MDNSQSTSVHSLLPFSVEQARETLRHNVVNIDFTKVDGSLRSMRATLQEDLIERYERKTNREKKVVEGNISVWDVDKNAWRTVKFDNITSFAVEFDASSI